MARRRQGKNEELLLIPFLDILCSLIGVLVLIVVVLCVAQSQRAKGRTQEELDRSQKYVDAIKKQKELDKKKEVLQVDVAKLDELRKQAAEQQEHLVRIRKLLTTSADIRKLNQELSQNLLKELDDLLLESEGLLSEQKPINAEIAKLMAELKSRQLPTQKVIPSVVVQSSGSGLAEGTKIFFVEASGGKLTIYWDPKQKTVLSAVPEVIAADVAYNHFLKEVQKVPLSKIVFLMRDDGTAAYNNAAGWAQATYNYRVDQIGRLLVPGRGEIDLRTFKDFLGTLPPPPEAKLVPVPGNTPPAAAPPASKPATPTPPAAAPPPPANTQATPPPAQPPPAPPAAPAQPAKS